MSKRDQLRTNPADLDPSLSVNPEPSGEAGADQETSPEKPPFDQSQVERLAQIFLQAIESGEDPDGMDVNDPCFEQHKDEIIEICGGLQGEPFVQLEDQALASAVEQHKNKKFETEAQDMAELVADIINNNAYGGSDRGLYRKMEAALAEQDLNAIESTLRASTKLLTPVETQLLDQMRAEPDLFNRFIEKANFEDYNVKARHEDV